MLIKTFIIDDTVLYRKIASDVANGFDDVEVIGTAPNGDIALKKLMQTPADLVLCDVHMPGKNGVEILEEIRRKFPNTLVVMMSGISTRSADITIKALEKGAVDFIQKPDKGSFEENSQRLREDMKRVLRLVQIRLATGNVDTARRTVALPVDNRREKSNSVLSPPSTKIPKKIAVIAIGVSTGGPEALNRLLPAIPQKISVPIVIVQHMPPQFTRSLAESIDRKSNIHIVEAEEGQIIKPGFAYIAPGGKHMTVRKQEEIVAVGINNGPPENSCKPSVDVLFRSVASVYGDKGVCAIILTGMGSDGLNGIKTLKRKGCLCITQSEESCVVYGMPRAIDEAGLSDISLPLDQISKEICRRLNM